MLSIILAHQIAEEILMGVSNGFPPNFRSEELKELVSKSERLRMQVKRLRVHVATRLLETLMPYELICPLSHLQHEAFSQIETELRQKGWNATWLSDATAERCGGQKGFLLVSV